MDWLRGAADLWLVVQPRNGAQAWEAALSEKKYENYVVASTAVMFGGQARVRRPAGLTDWAWNKLAEAVCREANSGLASTRACVAVMEEMAGKLKEQGRAQEWQPWGGEHSHGPLRSQTLVRVKLRDGSELNSASTALRWTVQQHPTDIVGWRLV